MSGIAFDDVNYPATLLKGENTLVIAVGIGNINIVQIYAISSDPDELFATTVEDFDALDKVVNVISRQIKLCTVSKLLLYITKLIYTEKSANSSHIVLPELRFYYVNIY